MSYNKYIFSYKNRFGTTTNITAVLEFIYPSLIKAKEGNAALKNTTIIRGFIDNVYLSDILIKIIDFMKIMEDDEI